MEVIHLARKKSKLNDNNLAIAYYRYSSHSQNEASIEQQRELAHEWADAHGLKIVREYEDAAISGTKEDRPGFQLMLSEVAKIRPNTLIAWKTDRLGRDKYVLAMAKKTIRDAGCEIHLLAENIPTDTAEGILIEGLMEALAEYYSRNLSVHIQRGMDFNAEHANFNGHKVFGFKTEKVDKKRKYVIDPDTAPFVQLMFAKYAEGEPMQSICDEFNEAGLRTSRGNPFGVKTMHRMLKNRAYIGEYRHGEFVVPGGMPALVDGETFDRAQKRLAENKRKGSQRARGMDEDGAPRYWLTGKLYCGECGETMQGVSGTSKTGRTYYYYYCSAQRKKLCAKKKVKKDWIEDLVTDVLRYIIDDSENLMSLAVDAAVYYKEHYKETGYLEGLEAKRKEVEKGIANLMKAIEGGALSDTLIERLNQLEAQKASLNDAIQAENVKVSLCEDEHSIKAYFEKFLHADFDNPETRDKILEYFVDKIYLYDEKLVVTSWYSEDKTEITWDMLKGADGDPFVKGEAAEFDCFPLGSTRALNEAPTQVGAFFHIGTQGQRRHHDPPGRQDRALNGRRVHGSISRRGATLLCMEVIHCFCNHQSQGLLAQRLAQGTHNPWVLGSNPGGPTRESRGRANNPASFSIVPTPYACQIALINVCSSNPRNRLCWLTRTISKPCRITGLDPDRPSIPCISRNAQVVYLRF